VNIEPIHWEKLKVYWSKLEIKKVEQMSNAKSKVKNLKNVGHIGKVGMEARLVFLCANICCYHHLFM
jgi:predicted transport protein